MYYLRREMVLYLNTNIEFSSSTTQDNMTTPTPPTPTPLPPTPPGAPPAAAQFSFERMVNKFRYLHLSLAEAIDVWRVVPRMFIALYGAMLWWLVKWFTSSTTIEKVTCDKDLILELMKQGVDMVWVQRLSCHVTEVLVVAPPTAVHATFASVVAGLSTAVFALYSTAGKDWTKGVGWWKAGRDKTPTITAPDPNAPPAPPVPPTNTNP